MSLVICNHVCIRAVHILALKLYNVDLIMWRGKCDTTT